MKYINELPKTEYIFFGIQFYKTLKIKETKHYFYESIMYTSIFGGDCITGYLE